MLRNTLFGFLSFLLSLNVVTVAYAAPKNLGRLKPQIIHYHDSGAYQTDIARVVDEAQRYIDAQATMNQHLNSPKKLALVLDIDETCLSNYDYLRTMDFANIPQQLLQHYMAADDPAIKPMLNLYQHALNQGVAVFFITGRNHNLKEATIKNLHKAGFNHWSGLEFSSFQGNVASAIPYKSTIRASIASKGYTILASIGDQYSDLLGGYAQKTFKLPNPYYYIP